MTIAAIAAFCIVLFVVALLAPRWSLRLQREGEKPLDLAARGAGKAPSPLSRWLRKPVTTSRKAVDKSGSAGRRTRFKLPF
jgi:hypothetical protein